MPHLEYYRESRIQLEREVRNHPPLMSYLLAENVNVRADYPRFLASIVTYLGAVIDEVLDSKQIEELENFLIQELKNRRAIVLSNPQQHLN